MITPVTLDVVPGEVLEIPVKHGEGQFVADAEELTRIEDDGQVVFPVLAADGTMGHDADNPNAVRTRSRACGTPRATSSD